jgi:uncharacterized membrane protein YbhN (UPF0104 family)
LGAGVRSGTGSRIGSTTIFLSGFPISIGASFPRAPTGMAACPFAGCQEARTSLEGRHTRPRAWGILSAMTVASEQEAHPRRLPWRVILRMLLLLATALSLYLLFPSLVDVFTQWRSLRHLNLWWIALAVVFEAASAMSLWEVQRIALRTPSWFAVGTAQLAGNAAGNIVPGGGATSGAVSYRLLVQAGVPADTVVGGLTAVAIANTAAILVFPLLALPAILGGLQAPSGLLQTAYIGAGAFVLLVVGGLAAFLWDRPLLIVGRGIDAVLRLFPSKRDAHGTGERLLLQRDALRHAFGARWPYALCGIAGKPGFDYLGLVCCLAAVGARPNPSLVILAYSGGVLLALIPFTPGGLGFVEAGLTGLLTLAGATAHQAVVATLAYRLLVFWLPLPLGGVAYLLHRRRYGADDASASATSP